MLRKFTDLSANYWANMVVSSSPPALLPPSSLDSESQELFIIRVPSHLPASVLQVISLFSFLTLHLVTLRMRWSTWSIQRHCNTKVVNTCLLWRKEESEQLFFQDPRLAFENISGIFLIYQYFLKKLKFHKYETGLGRVLGCESSSHSAGKYRRPTHAWNCSPWKVAWI